MTADEELQRLRDRVEELEGLLGIGDDAVAQIRRTIKTTRMVGKIIGALHKARGILSAEALFIALYGDRSEGEQPRELKVVEVHISRARRDLKPHGIEIETIFMTGYCMTAKGKQRLAEMIEPQPIAEAA